VTVLLVSSTLIDAPLFRVTVQPDKINNMQKPSQVMVDKAMTVKRDKLGEAFGSAGDEVMLEVGRCLAVFLGIAR
jgi:mRNA interferase MazF